MWIRYGQCGLVIPVVLVALLILVSCGGGRQEGAELSDEVKEMVRYYESMREIGLAGDVEKFLEMRDSVTNAEVAAYFEWRRFVLDSAKVSSWAYNWPSVAGLPLEQDTSDGEWRRLTFRREGFHDKDGKEQVIYPHVLFRKNGDIWKVSNASSLVSYRYNDDGSLRTLSQLTYNKLFLVPPSFDPLKEPPATDSMSIRRPVKMGRPGR